ncbi:hypothetical protein PMAYCL1PPCAC_28241, partial [Pristionchus mayeri]
MQNEQQQQLQLQSPQKALQHPQTTQPVQQPVANMEQQPQADVQVHVAQTPPFPAQQLQQPQAGQQQHAQGPALAMPADQVERLGAHLGQSAQEFFARETEGTTTPVINLEQLLALDFHVAPAVAAAAGSPAAEPPRLKMNDPPSHIDKLWRNVNVGFEDDACPRGCDREIVGETRTRPQRTEHQKTYHHPIYYQTSQSMKSKKEHEKWLYRTLGNHMKGLRTCPKCPGEKRFYTNYLSRIELAAHLKQFHPAEFPALREECHRVFPTRDDIPLGLREIF